MFDKTGTLTHGKPRVVHSQMLHQVSSSEQLLLLAAIGTAEASSEHPLGVAICEHAKEECGVEHLGQVTDFEVVPGYGLVCTVFGLDAVMKQSSKLGASFDLWRKLSEGEDHRYHVLVGNCEWMNKNQISVSMETQEAMKEFQHLGHTVVLAAVDGNSLYQY